MRRYMDSKLQVLPYLAYAQMGMEPSSLQGPVAPAGPLSKDMALALGLPSGNVDILRHRSVQRDAMPDWKLFQLFDVPPDPKNFKARLSYTRMDRRQSAHMNALHRLVYGKAADECGRKVCKEYARAYAIEVFCPRAMRMDWAQFAVDKRGRKWQQQHSRGPLQLIPPSPSPSHHMHAQQQQQLFGSGHHRERAIPKPAAAAGLVEGFPVSSGNLKEGEVTTIARGGDSGCSLREWKLQNAKRLLGFQSAASSSTSHSNSPQGFPVTTSARGVQLSDLLKLGFKML